MVSELGKLATDTHIVSKWRNKDLGSCHLTTDLRPLDTPLQPKSIGLARKKGSE